MLNRIHIIAIALVTVLPVTAVPTAQAAVLADFDGSTAGSNPTAANLNAGTSGGSWTISGLIDASVTKIQEYSDAPGNHQLQLDGSRASSGDPFDYRLDFDSIVALDGTYVLSWDMLLRRRAGGGQTGNERSPLIVAYDSLGATLFEIRVYGVDGATTPSGTVIVEGQAPSSTAVGFLLNSSQPATTDMTNISIALGASTFDVVVGGVTAYTGIAYSGSVTDLAGLSFTATGPFPRHAGYSLDNIQVVPEPAAAGLLLLGGVAGLLRRRRRA